MKIPLNLGGGGGSGSDDCTATASDVLESKTAIYNGSDDEPEYGTMKDYSGTTNAASAITQNGSNSRIELTVPNTGKYDTTSKIYYAYSSLASTIGLTAAKIATGNTILGITGTYTGLGSATAAQVLTGKTFSTASLSNATGTMTDKSGTTTSATSSLDSSNSRVRLQIPTNGYYNTSAYLYASYSNIASLIGLTAAKIASSYSILGVTGTAKEYAEYTGSASLTTSGHSTESWTNQVQTVTMRYLTLSDIGLSSFDFTPVWGFFFWEHSSNCCSSSACNITSEDYNRTGYYSTSTSSQYVFSKTSMHIPCYFTSSCTLYYRVVGYK